MECDLFFFETQYLAGSVPGQWHADFKDLKSIWHMEIELWKKYKKGKHQTVFEVRNPPTISVISVYRWKPPASMLISLPSSEMFFHQQEDPICHIFSVWVLQKYHFWKPGVVHCDFLGSHFGVPTTLPSTPRSHLLPQPLQGRGGSTSLTKRYSDIPNIKIVKWLGSSGGSANGENTNLGTQRHSVHVHIYIYICICGVIYHYNWTWSKIVVSRQVSSLTARFWLKHPPSWDHRLFVLQYRPQKQLDHKLCHHLLSFPAWLLTLNQLYVELPQVAITTAVGQSHPV